MHFNSQSAEDDWFTSLVWLGLEECIKDFLSFLRFFAKLTQIFDCTEREFSKSSCLHLRKYVLPSKAKQCAVLIASVLRLVKNRFKVFKL